MTRSPGFTLVELVVTIAVMSIMVAFALPAMLDLGRDGGNGEAEPLRGLLVEAAGRSQRNASEVEVVVVPESGRWRLWERRAGQEVVVEEGRVPLPGTGASPSGERFRVVFRRVGVGVGDTLAVAGRVVRVDGVTGAVEVDP